MKPLLRNKITNFFQEPNETFNEAWERFKGLLRQCPHHGFSELHQLDTFYNSLNSNDQDALDSAAGGNFLDKMPQEGLAIIESKSKVRYSRSRANDSRVSTDAPLSNSSPSNNSFDMQQIAASLEDKMTIKMKQMMNEMKALVVTTPAPVKAVEEVSARDETLVLTAERVKNSSTNMRIDPRMTQKEETFQVVLDLIKASPCYNAFLVTDDVPEIYMQQFWFTIKKIKKTTSYEFNLADKKCKVDVEQFRKILDICPRVPNKDFIIPPSEESLINLLYELGY
ncbi:reverse transcriptase domain-containing protein [Tanacetum coccineum]|uniref:Reverse transcriptase domain-containing protein n=1 Tax=Tanacetum coccineum TaxID=301880 RepID=A0ABQ5B4I4_9ASTR